MDTIHDFEDVLALLEKHKVRYLIIGGLAFIDHAKPLYTKDMNIWIDPRVENVGRANKALSEFGSPFLSDPKKIQDIPQLGIAPGRTYFLLHVPGAGFETAWKNRIRGRHGEVTANWIDLNSLIRIKSKNSSFQAQGRRPYSSGSS